MGFALIGAGLLFLANPNFNIIDILPDFIGLLLVYFGLIKLSHINADINDAKKQFLTLAAVGVLKFFSIGMLNAQDPTWYLLLSFSFGVVECILFVYAANSLFTGIEWLGVKYNSEFVFRTYNTIGIVGRDDGSGSVGKVKRDVITRTKNTAIAFYFVRTACATIPEFTLIMKENLYVDYYKIYRPALYIIGTLITVVWGVIFLVRLFSFISGIIRDSEFFVSLKEAHTDFVAANVNFSTSRRMRFVLLAYSLAILSTFRIGEDGLAFIPTAIPAALLIVCILLMYKDNGNVLAALVPTAATVVLSVKSYMAALAFYVGSTKLEDIFHFEKYYGLFKPLSDMALVEYALLLMSFAAVSFFIFRQIKEHSTWEREYTGMSDKAIADHKEENRLYLKKLITLLCFIFGAVLVLNTVGVKLALLAGFAESDYFIVAYQVYIAVTAVMTLVSFVISRRLSEFVSSEIYSVEYSWSNY